MQDEKKAGIGRGWHRANNSKHAEAVDKYREAHGPAARRSTAAIKKAERDQRTPQQQLAELDRRLGPGQGAKDERQRLMTLILNQ